MSECPLLREKPLGSLAMKYSLGWNCPRQQDFPLLLKFFKMENPFYETELESPSLMINLTDMLAGKHSIDDSI